MALKEADKRAIRAFSDERAAEGPLVSSDGKTLEKLGMGGHKLAYWKGGKVVWCSVEAVRSDMEIKRVLKKQVPSKLFMEEYHRNAIPRTPETPAHVRAASRGRSETGRGDNLSLLREMVREREGREFDPTKRGTWRGSSKDLVVNGIKQVRRIDLVKLYRRLEEALTDADERKLRSVSNEASQYREEGAGRLTGVADEFFQEVSTCARLAEKAIEARYSGKIDTAMSMEERSERACKQAEKLVDKYFVQESAAARDVVQRQGFDPAVFMGPEMSPNGIEPLEASTHEEITYGIATGLWLQAWADAYEEATGDSLSGAIEDVAPSPDDETLTFAIEVGNDIEEINGKALDQMFREAKEAGRAYGTGKADPEVFGYYLAMQGLGHGVSWLDDWNEPKGGWFKLPHLEFHLECDEEGENCAVSYKSSSKRLAR